ncbi:MAG: SAM-dependent methyltransferase [Acidobacteriaceae bacterium]|nr:SAM-dependent methyltransferase [Acidobacteriaceae bacterium]
MLFFWRSPESCGDNGGVGGTGTAELEEIIREEVSRDRCISFARFMELALYHPRLGYYRQSSNPLGTFGDFYTAEQLQPVFGQLVASFASRVAPWAGEERFQIVELGAGRGELRDSLPEWRYLGCDWRGDPLPASCSGLVIANEFFDALPVRVLRRGSDGWSELVVTWGDGAFAFEERPQVSPDMLAYADKYGEAIPAGGLLEVNFGIETWLERIATFLRCGSVLIIDYGYSARELVRFPRGTLMSYHRHVGDTEVLLHPGTRDITAHVNFSHLKDEAVRNTFEIVSEESLASWVLSVWKEHDLARRWEAGDERWRLQWKSIAIGMGEVFRVLTLRKVSGK